MDELTVIENKIHEIRGQKVMLDFDLAEMYGVETKRLKEQVRRNSERFPSDFMFELSKKEWSELVANCDRLPDSLKHSSVPSFAFTEQGVAMLSGILRSPQAIEVNINIMRAFVRMRQYLLSNIPKQELDELKKRVEYLEEDISSDRESYETQFEELFTAFAKVSAIIQSKTASLDRVRIQGFKNQEDK